MIIQLLTTVLTLWCTAAFGDVDPELAHKATDELAYLEKAQFIDLYSPKYFGACSNGNIGRLRLIEFFNQSDVFPLTALLRGTFQVQTLPQSAATNYKKQTGYGDTQLLCLVIAAEGEWGRMGVGPMAILPTASRLHTGQGKWQLGPAFGIAYLGIPMWQFELLVQNPISFAGRKSAPYINQMIFQPIITHHFGHGWYIKTDAEWTIVWNRHSYNIPINLGLGKVFDWWGQKLDVICYSQWTAYHRNSSNTAKYTIKVELDLLFPE